MNKFTILFLVSTPVYAHSGNPDMIWGMYFMGSVAFLLFSLMLRLFVKNNTLIYIALFLIVFFFLILLIKEFRHDFEIRSMHLFQEPNTYGVYKGNQTIAGTENLNIIYMSQPFWGIPNILDDNKTVHIAREKKLQDKIYVKELAKVTYFKDSGAGNILMFEHREDNNISLVSYRPIRGKQDRNQVVGYTYDEDSTNFYLYRYNDLTKDYKRDTKSYESVAFYDTQRLEKAFLKQEPIVLIDKENKQLRLFKKRNREQFRPFHVPYTPKMAVCESNSDRVFVVYEEVKGVYVLENVNAKIYNHIQELIKRLIDISVRSPKKLAELKIHSLSSEQLNRLEEILRKKPSIRYRYKIDVYNNLAYVYVTSESYPSLHITFVLSNNETWNISNIIQMDHERLKVLGSL